MDAFIFIFAIVGIPSILGLIGWGIVAIYVSIEKALNKPR